MGDLALTFDPANIKNVVLPVGAGPGSNLVKTGDADSSARRLRRRRGAAEPLAPPRRRRPVAETDACVTLDTSRTNTSTGSSRNTGAPGAGRQSRRGRVHPLAPRGLPPARPGRRHPLVASGCRPSTHFAHRRNVVVATGTASGKSLCYQMPIVESIVGGGARHGAADLPDQGPRPGPATHASASGWSPTSWLRRTTATPRSTSGRGSATHANVIAHQPRDAAHGDPAVARALGDVPPATCATSSSTSCTPCGGCSAATWRTCCGGSVVCASTTAPSPRSASPVPRSATRRSSRRGSAAFRSRRSTATAHRRPSAASRCGSDRSIDAHTGTRGIGKRRDRDAAVALRRRRAPDARVHPQPQGRRARRGPRAARAGRARAPTRRRAAPARRRVPRRLPRRRAARARGAAGERRARRCRGNQRARARHRRRFARRGGAQRLPGHARRRCASRWGGRGARRGGRPRCSSPATTSSTSGTRAIPTSCSPAPPRPRS